MDIHPQVIARVAQLDPTTQEYVIKKFRPTGHNNSKSLTNFLNSIEKGSLNDADGSKVEKIMRVDYTGGILGCTLPDLGSFDGINTEHAAIICHESRFFVQDMGSECGTFVDGAQIGTDWVQLRNGTQLRLGPQCAVVVELTGASIDLPPGVEPPPPQGQPAGPVDDGGVWKLDGADEALAAKKRRAAYEDRAGERQKRNRAAIDTAIDGLNAKFLKQESARVAAEEAEAQKEEEEEAHAYKDDMNAGNMRMDGEFTGPSFGARAGIGFASEMEEEKQSDPWAQVQWKKSSKRDRD
jgi:hypothetical protein